jgi:hypothetical protein
MGMSHTDHSGLLAGLTTVSATGKGRGVRCRGKPVFLVAVTDRGRTLEDRVVWDS